MSKIEEFFWGAVAFITWVVFAVIGIALYVGIPIAGLYIVYKVAKYLFTGEW